MATGVQPRDEEHQLTRSDLENIQEAMKNKKFRELLNDYCEEVRDPANQAIYQKEMTQLEKERGYDVTFINPKGGYVIKTSVAGDRKAFINICSNENVGKPSCQVRENGGQKGMNWQIPYSMIPPREDYNNKRERCVIYDVVYHPDTLRMAAANEQFRELVNKTAFEGLQKTYNIHLDSNNCKSLKSQYKGMTIPAVIRTEDPNYKPPTEEETEDLTPDVIEKLYPQHIYPQKQAEPPHEPEDEEVKPQPKRKTKTSKPDFAHSSENGYTIPKYTIKQQKAVDFQDFTFHKNSKQYSAIPSHIVVEVYLPLLSSTKDCTLDVKEKSLSMKSEKPAKYKLNINLPYPVDDECGNAKFDKSKRKLIVTLPVIRKNAPSDSSNSLKVDSGVESEENSGSQSEEENVKENLVVELSSTEPVDHSLPQRNISQISTETFLDPSIAYTLPSYTYNALDDIVALTFHVKNTEPDSVIVKKDGSKIFIKFTTVGSGFVPVHYAAMIVFDESVKFENVLGEAWDNNVILQLELTGDIPQGFQIGVDTNSMANEYFDMSQVKRAKESNVKVQEDLQSPTVEVTNSRTETNIVVSSNTDDLDEDDLDSPITKDDFVWSDPGTLENGAKSILRKTAMMRSYSESSVGDVASSMDYISSDCIPEESSLKKSVRFSNVIAKKFYRYNSSIEGQKKKNQRKKSKKRNLERRKSESEAEDEFTSTQNMKPRLKSVLKPRRDSGLTDTSDAEHDSKYTPSDIDSSYDCKRDNRKAIESIFNIVNKNGNVEETSDSDPALWKSEETAKRDPTTCDNIKHNTDLYNPDKLNKGKYLEVSFKNDLIFDLDM